MTDDSHEDIGENFDKDLQDLLNQLDDQDEFLQTQNEINDTTTQEHEISIAETKKTKAKNQKKNKPTKNQNNDEKVLRPTDELVAVDHRVINTEEQTIKTDQPQFDLSKYLDQMDGVSKEVLQACQSDRQEAQDVINMLRHQVDNAHNKGATPSRMYVDGLVKSVEVKAGINATAVKMMEGVAKMIAATKAGINVQNNNLTISSGELDDMLGQDIQDDLD